MSALSWLKNPWRKHTDVPCVVEGKASVTEYGIRIMLKTFVTPGIRGAFFEEYDGTTPRWLPIWLGTAVWKQLVDAVDEWKAEQAKAKAEAAQDEEYGPKEAATLRKRLEDAETAKEEAEARAEELEGWHEEEVERSAELEALLLLILTERNAGRDPFADGGVRADLLRVMGSEPSASLLLFAPTPVTYVLGRADNDVYHGDPGLSKLVGKGRKR